MTEAEGQDFQTVMDEFSECFATDMSGLGQATNAEMTITVKSDAIINSRPYRILFAPYASPIVLVKKQNGEDRLCVDYRQLLNSHIRCQLSMNIYLAVLSGNTIFTLLDLVAGYHQIPITESSKNYTAFVTNDGHYEFNRMPFGTKCFPNNDQWYYQPTWPERSYSLSRRHHLTERGYFTRNRSSSQISGTVQNHRTNPSIIEVQVFG